MQDEILGSGVGLDLQDDLEYCRAADLNGMRYYPRSKRSGLRQKWRDRAAMDQQDTFLALDFWFSGHGPFSLCFVKKHYWLFVAFAHEPFKISLKISNCKKLKNEMVWSYLASANWGNHCQFIRRWNFNDPFVGYVFMILCKLRWFENGFKLWYLWSQRRENFAPGCFWRNLF